MSDIKQVERLLELKRWKEEKEKKRMQEIAQRKKAFCAASKRQRENKIVKTTNMLTKPGPLISTLNEKKDSQNGLTVRQSEKIEDKNSKCKKTTTHMGKLERKNPPITIPGGSRNKLSKSNSNEALTDIKSRVGASDKKSSVRSTENLMKVNFTSKAVLPKVGNNRVQPGENRVPQRKDIQISRRTSCMANKTGKTSSILKRKSCMPSIPTVMEKPPPKTKLTEKKEACDVEMGDAHGPSVRFLSPTRSCNHNKENKMSIRSSAKKLHKKTSMRSNLTHWLKEKGRTPSKFTHLMCFGAEMSERKKVPPTKSCLTVDELSKQQAVLQAESMQDSPKICKNLTEEFLKVKDDEEKKIELHSLLEECETLFNTGCSVDFVLPWLDEMYNNFPAAKHSAAFYICKAKILMIAGAANEVIDVFAQAVNNSAKPPDELAKALKETWSRQLVAADAKSVHSSAQRAEIENEDENVEELLISIEESTDEQRPQKRAKVEEDNIFPSSIVQFEVREITPFSKKCPPPPDGQFPPPCAVITPVRRSTRRSVTSHPDSTKKSEETPDGCGSVSKTKVFNSLKDIKEDDDQQNVLFKPNKALESLYDDLGVQPLIQF